MNRSHLRTRRRLLRAQAMRAGSDRRRFMKDRPHLNAVAAETPKQATERLTGVATALGVVVAFIGVGASLWVGKTTSEVANDTRQDAIVAQRATQFSLAAGQLSSDTPDVQLGAIYSLESLVVSDPETYRLRGCDLVRSFIDSRAVRRNPQQAASHEPSIAVLGGLNVAGRACLNAPGMVFRGLQLKGARLPGATLQGIDLSRADLMGADLTGAQATAATFREAEMIGVKLDQAQLVGADFTSAELSHASLAQVTLREAHLSNSTLNEANLRGADLRNAALGGRASLILTQLDGADLRGAVLTEARLTGAQLSHADLTGANLARSRLDRSFLRGATLAEVDLTGADLTDADLTAVDFSGVTYDASTIWPRGFVPPDTEQLGR